MNTLWPVAYVTFIEGVRNRALHGISLIAIFLLIVNYLISSMVMQDVGKVAVDMAVSAVSFSGLLIVLFVGINLMAKDLDRRTIYMVLSRPISRSQYLVGKFLGVVLILLTVVLVLTVFAVLSIYLIKLTYAHYVLRLSWSLVIMAISFSTLMLIMLTALSFLFSTFTSTSFITLVLTIITYIIGNSLNDVKALVEAPQVVGIHVSPLTVKIVQAAYYILPNLSLFDIKAQAAHGIALAPSYVAWTLLYGVVYIGIAITLAAVIMRKKEFA